MTGKDWYKPIKSHIGINERHKCRRCWRTLSHDQFGVLYRERPKHNTSGRYQLLHPFCYKCREMITGQWVKHPAYTIKADAFFGRLLSMAKANAAQRGIAFMLEKDDLLGLYLQQEGKCALSGCEMLLDEGAGVRNNMRASIDRVNSSESYTLDNVQIVCAIANLMKNDMPQAQFIDMCRKIVERQADVQDELLDAIGG